MNLQQLEKMPLSKDPREDRRFIEQRNKHNRTAFKWIHESIEYWSKLIDESFLGVDWCEADVYCWRCGCNTPFHKCHIIPQSLGGNDDPSNIIPLCSRCHCEMPDVLDSKFVFEWIKDDHGNVYGTFWNNKSIKPLELLIKRLCDTGIPFSKEILNKWLAKTSVHFHPIAGGINKTSSKSWAIKNALLEMLGDSQ